MISCCALLRRILVFVLWQEIVHYLLFVDNYGHASFYHYILSHANFTDSAATAVVRAAVAKSLRDRFFVLYFVGLQIQNVSNF